jgi:hypothetical protein
MGQCDSKPITIKSVVPDSLLTADINKNNDLKSETEFRLAIRIAIQL